MFVILLSIFVKVSWDVYVLYGHYFIYPRVSDFLISFSSFEVFLDVDKGCSFIGLQFQSHLAYVL
jgi:hypothetical protein